jgi:hypothetical protein
MLEVSKQMMNCFRAALQMFQNKILQANSSAQCESRSFYGWRQHDVEKSGQTKANMVLDKG